MALADDRSLNEQIISSLHVDADLIKQQIALLYQQFLGQDKQANDSDITHLFDLWQAVYQQRLDSKASPYVHNEDGEGEFCFVDWEQIHWDRLQGNDYRNLQRMRQELGAYYNLSIVRSWAAVLMFLMTDYQFIFK